MTHTVKELCDFSSNFGWKRESNFLLADEKNLSKSTKYNSKAWAEMPCVKSLFEYHLLLFSSVSVRTDGRL